MFWLVITIVALVAFTLIYLRGENLSEFDQPPLAQSKTSPSEAHLDVVAAMEDFARQGQRHRGKQRLKVIRDYLDSMSEGRDFVSEFRAETKAEVRGEWVLAPGADPRRRLLYIHGGAWMAGSPKSHRALTNKLSMDTGCAVFSLDYRLMPENRRRDSVEDCKAAYRWILEHGPDGQEALDYLVVAGDSAGGNLTLVTVAWARDEGLRKADAAIAFSPATDSAMTSPSLTTNLATDPMLGPAFGFLTKIPLALLWWASWLSTRIRPADPVVSPIRGNLAGLPPILIQASEAEMLLDDSRRYVAKAQAAGSPVELQTWPHMVHVWQMFTPELPEAEEAYDKLLEFLQRVQKSNKEGPVA
ncbi:alpha/beta hydrolase [Parahaliea sp. F7430]|uniref:Alpha/beta hydrolase n=1 Tax=Sediminihaliea albiluteola TaxID=2758564 RepID=A0A7W2YIF1_9GAMM|nr:alpha/beta hydrolase [Sediminihaliea albiluteola]MBA6412010.1 alpha/beta hydrolase [Sediminihaliea albiluteola]